jgi:LuxR family maltose regulon positive regulatory protein
MRELTNRENEIVSLVKQSLTNKQIAERLSIKTQTVYQHIRNIFIKKRISSRKELMDICT